MPGNLTLNKTTVFSYLIPQTQNSTVMGLHLISSKIGRCSIIGWFENILINSHERFKLQKNFFNTMELIITNIWGHILPNFSLLFSMFTHCIKKQTYYKDTQVAQLIKY